MGFLDNVSDSINRGAAAAGRTGKSAKLKMQMNELLRERQKLTGQLGASLYNDVKDDARLRVGREPLFEQIALVDKQRDAIQAEIGQLETAATASAAATQTYTCPKCGIAVPAGDMFCSGCGTPIAEIKVASAASAVPNKPDTEEAFTCPKCGSSVPAEDMFCISCGTPIAEIKAAAAAPASAGTEGTGQKTCPSCGAPIEADDMFCMACGAKLETTDNSDSAEEPPESPAKVEGPFEALGQAVEPAQSEEQPQPGAMPQEQPEAKVQEEALSSTDEQEQEETLPQMEEQDEKKCPSCGAPLDDDNIFCANCGTKLDGAEG